MDFISNPKRDASDVIAGYVYQVDVTVSRWLNLQPNELLELERGEDLDVVRFSDDHAQDIRTLEQVKKRAAPLTLRSVNALTALANFCEHRQKNPSHRLKFRYVTTSSIGRETGWTLEKTAIELWESVRTGELAGGDESAAILAIRGFVRGCEKPGGIKNSTWSFLENALANGNDAEFEEVIKSLEWSTGSGDPDFLEADIKRGLIESNYAEGQEAAQRLFARLFLFVIKRLTGQDLKMLTVEELREQLNQSPLGADDLEFVEEIRTLGRRVASLERESAQDRSLLQSVTEQVQMLAGAYKAVVEYQPSQVSLDVPALATPGIRRSQIVDRVTEETERRTWVSVVGEPGSGKTQLCLLITNKLGSDTVWISLRGLTQERSCAAMDAALEASSGVNRHPIIQQWYAQVVGRLEPGMTIVLDDLPAVVLGSALDQRLQFLQAACQGRHVRMMSTTYYEVPRALVEADVVTEVYAPRFISPEILELLQVHGAPSSLTSASFADFLAASTEGLPVIVAAIIRFLISKNWIFEWKNIESLLKGEYAAGLKRDATALIQATVPDLNARELLYRLTCVVGPISREQVEAVGEIPAEIRLCMEKLNQLVGLWVQPYGGNTYLLSPLVDKQLAETLDSSTRKRVHGALGALILRKKVSTLDIIICVHHFREAQMENTAGVVLIQALMKIAEVETEVRDEWMISSVWAYGPLPESMDINLRLNLRAFQIALADKRNKDASLLIEDLSQLLTQAKTDDEAQLGVFMASGYLATRLFRKNPSLANLYILMALRSAPKALLPDGSKPAIPKEMALEWMLWGTAIATTSDAEVENWLETVAQLRPAQIKVLSESEFSEDNSTVLCDSVWLREYRKPEHERNWDRTEKTLRLIEEKADDLGLELLSAAALRTQILILAECRNQLSQAVAAAQAALTTAKNDGVRFLIEEVTGRQLAYAGQWEEALRWMGSALGRRVKWFVLLRRNLLVTVGEGVARYEPAAATEYSRQAVAIAVTGNLEPTRVAEALGEYTIALWEAGRREEAFTQWQEAVQTLFRFVDQSPSCTQAVLGFLHAAGYFGNMVLFGRPPNVGYSAPVPGFFLALDNISVESYKPIQKNLLFIQTAVFAEGVKDTEAAGRWAKLALDIAPSETGSGLLQPFIWLAIAPAALANEYKDVIQRARSISTPAINQTVNSLEAQNIQPEDCSPDSGILSEPRRIEMSLLFGAVPLAFRLATLRFERDVSTDIEAVNNDVETLTGIGDVEWKEAATLMKSILSNDTPWKQLHARVQTHYSRNHVAFGILYFLGAILSAPYQQSLALQIALARDLEKLFETKLSIRFKIILPFFERYWSNATTSRSTIFRTSAAYARKSYDEAVLKPVSVRLKELFQSMVFCIGLSLPVDLQKWLDTQ
jgi:hypothetical protein